MSPVPEIHWTSAQMVKDQPAVPCNNGFSRAQKTRVRRLLPKGAFHTASLLLL